MLLRSQWWMSAVVAGVCWYGVGAQIVEAQQVSYEHATPQVLAGIAKDNSRHFGDDPDDGGPIATDLSPSLDSGCGGEGDAEGWGLATGAVGAVF